MSQQESKSIFAANKSEDSALPPVAPTSDSSACAGKASSAALKQKAKPKNLKIEDEALLKDVFGDEKLDKLSKDMVKLQGTYKDLENKISFCIDGIHRILTKLDSAKLNRSAFGRAVDIPIVDTPAPALSVGGATAVDAPKRSAPAPPDPAPEMTSNSTPTAAAAAPQASAPKPATGGSVATRSTAKWKNSEADLLLQLDSRSNPPPASPSVNINNSLTQAEKARFSAATGRPPDSMVVVLDVAANTPAPLVWEDDEDSEETFGDVDPKVGEKRKPATRAEKSLKRPKLPDYAIGLLKKWIRAHPYAPYPTEEEKAQLVTDTGLTLVQINNWFSNARRRLLKKNERGEEIRNKKQQKQ